MFNDWNQVKSILIFIFGAQNLYKKSAVSQRNFQPNVSRNSSSTLEPFEPEDVRLTGMRAPEAIKMLGFSHQNNECLFCQVGLSPKIYKCH